MAITSSIQARREEIVNTSTHGIGIFLSVIALVMMLIHTIESQNPWFIVSSAVYGISLIMLYTASTVYHGSTNLRRKSFLNKLDHSAIYLLIAGTYTPYTLITLRGAWGWSIFGVIWFLAIVGVVFKLNFYKKKYRKISALLYILMGWIVVVAFVPLTHALPTMGIVWLIAGGLAYSIGVLFYIPENLPYSHGIFHLFIIAGSLFHFFSVMGYVLQ